MFSLEELLKDQPDLPHGLLELQIFVLYRAWKEVEMIGLSRVCARFGVQHLRIICDSGSDMTLLEKEGRGKDYVRLTKLRTVRIKGLASINAPLSMLARSTVGRLTWNLHSEYAPVSANGIIQALTWARLLSNNFALREVVLFHEDEDRVKGIIEDGYAKELKEILERNQTAHKRCQKAIIALLTLRRRREINASRDVMSVITGMVWETRGTVIWAK